MTDERLIAEAARRLAAAAPEAEIILFGSHARGDARPDSDLDLLVIEPKLVKRRQESARLRQALGDLGVPINLVVITKSHAEEWGHFEGTFLNDALSDGRSLVRQGLGCSRKPTPGRTEPCPRGGFSPLPRPKDLRKPD
jgi:uncharacterized protein